MDFYVFLEVLVSAPGIRVQILCCHLLLEAKPECRVWNLQKFKFLLVSLHFTETHLTESN